MPFNNNAGLKSFIGINETGELLIEPITAESKAFAVTTVVTTKGVTYRIPKITQDPSAAWVAESQEIPLSEATGGEVIVTPTKIAALSSTSNELANDSDPQALQAVGDGIGRDIARKIDLAFFGAAPVDSPVQQGGLESAAHSILVADPTASLDPYVDAMSIADGLGVAIDVFVVDPQTGTALAKMKSSDGSNQPLLSPTANNGTLRTIHGVPYIVSPFVLPGTAWGIPKSRAFTILREDTSITIDSSVLFTSDRVAIRGVARVGFGFPQPEAIIKIKAGG
ncbi:phage major capsid protein [Frondihabitans sucicola]|uniref:phage major capsid protein n=1 Tax=Frondihabitans sucicola TaxID=1268041 RepID=UPI0025730A1B|nr:phage major capsid protein [Frondihabitans sucicola]